MTQQHPLEIAPEIELNIRQGIKDLITNLWPGNPDNLKRLPESVDREEWFRLFIQEKRQLWTHQQEEFKRFGRFEDSHKVMLKLSQLNETLTLLDWSDV